MTRTKAWVIAAAATVTVILAVLAAGASFGQFGLGDSGAQASVDRRGTEGVAPAGENDEGGGRFAEDYEDDEDHEADERDDDDAGERHDDDDDEHNDDDDDDEHEDEDEDD